MILCSVSMQHVSLPAQLVLIYRAKQSMWFHARAPFCMSRSQLYWFTFIFPPLQANNVLIGYYYSMKAISPCFGLCSCQLCKLCIAVPNESTFHWIHNRNSVTIILRDFPLPHCRPRGQLCNDCTRRCGVSCRRYFSPG